MACAGCGSILSAAENPGLAYCESCAVSYRGAAARMELDLAALARAVGQSLTASLRHEPSSKEADFFISFSHADRDIAECINSILKAHGYSTVFLASGTPGRNFVLEMHEGLKRARRMILLLSPDYLESAYAVREWQSFFTRDPDGRRRLLVPFRVAGCEADGLFAPLDAVSLVGKKGRALEDAVIGGLGASGTRMTGSYSFPPADDKPLPEDEDARRTNAPVGWVPLLILTMFIAVLATVPVMSTDISLPVRWMVFNGNLRERATVETDATPLRHWMDPAGSPPNLRWNRQWLDVGDMALLRSTLAARDGIAQYTVGFPQGSLALLSRAAPGGQIAYETRLEYTRPGVLRILVGRRDGRRLIEIPHSREAPVYVGTRTMHDVAVSMKDDLHTLWLNGSSITTFRDGLLKQGAVGLSALARDKVRLYRYSLNLEVAPQTGAFSIQPVYWARMPSLRDGSLGAE